MPLTKKQKTRRKIRNKERRHGLPASFKAEARGAAKKRRDDWSVPYEFPRSSKPSGSIYAY